MTIADNDPLSAHYKLTQSYEMGRDGWRTKVDTVTEMHSDLTNFYIRGELTASENGAVVATRNWDQVIKRDGL